MARPGLAERAGFSLVEVVLALGIFSFAIISVIGLMGSGIKISHDAVTESAKSRIFDHLSQLVGGENPAPGSQDFTADGLAATNTAEAVYTAQWSLAASAGSGPAAGLRASRVWIVTIARHGVAGPPAATNFIVTSAPPASL